MSRINEISHSDSSAAPFETRPRRGGANTVVFSLTAICFLFGGLLAFGARSVQAVRENEVEKHQNLALQQDQLEKAQSTLAREEKRRHDLETSLNAAKIKLAATGKMSEAQAKKLSSEMKKLQALLGLTPVKGPGIVIRLTDNPDAAKNAGPDAGPFLPGIIHDFDLLQVVNELRNSKAEAIAINGVRITGFTPIRCVGAPIYINYEPKPAPFEIVAVGNADDLENALSMPGGILENLKNQTLGVRIRKEENLSLPAATGIPELRSAKIG
jgi:uncharacterized protein YlxW (UPF0749 family)